MSNRTLPVAALLASSLVVGGWTVARGERVAAAAHAAEVRADSLAAYELDVRGKDIEFWAARAARDPESAEDRAYLAATYLQRARETGSYQDYLRAEEAARASLALRSAHNGKTLLTLASALMAQHRFVEARVVAAEVLALDPQEPAFRALVGEVQLELGAYDSATATFAELARGPLEAGVATRVARWAELTGRSGHARGVLTAARRELLASTAPREQKAWAHLRVGDLELRRGRPRAAETAYRAGLALIPRDYRLLGAMARLRAAEGKWRDAADFGERALAVTLDPGTLALLGDAATALGDSAKAAEYERALDVAVLSQPGPLHRAVGLHFLDRGRHVADVLARAAAELGTRRDVYGYDLVAWALHAAGRDAEAREPARRALAQGTEDALLYYHAGMIARAVGDSAEAARCLRRALDLNRAFHPFHADSARRALADLPR